MQYKRFLVLIGLMLMMLGVAGCSTTLGNKPVYQSDGLAIRGYDPVAYFDRHAAVKGKPEHRLHWQAADWYFASAANKQAFVLDPHRYAPQYGGYCAYAMANGFVVSSDPEAWSIRDGKLYLNYSKGVRDRWLKDAPAYIQRAAAEWVTKSTEQ